MHAFTPDPYPISVVVADSQTLFRQGLRLLIAQEPDIRLVGEAENGSDVVSLAIELAPDVALLGRQMPEIDGIEAARQIKTYVSTTKTILVSGVAFDQAAFESLEKGVDGFVHKDVDFQMLVQAIRTTNAGQRFLSPDATTALIDQSRRSVKPPQLSPRELEVLNLMATRLTYADIAERLVLSEATVRTYVRRIFVKLERPTRTSAVLEAIRGKLIDFPD